QAAGVLLPVLPGRHRRVRAGVQGARQQDLRRDRPAAAPEIAIIGHSDRVGTVPYNDALSLRRAERCRDELLKLGIPKVRISIAGRGWREPEIPTAQDVSEPRNRRVEISVR